LKLELAILDSFIEIFRNSIDSESLILFFKEVGLWSCGKWGNFPGFLIENGQFEDENQNMTEADNTSQFEDAMSGKEEDADFHTYEGNRFSVFDSNKRHHKTHLDQSEDMYKLMIIGVEIKTNHGAEDTVFVRLAKESLTLDIILAEEASPGVLISPLKRIKIIYIFFNYSQVIIRIPSLKVFAYEPDFELLMKLLQENLGESPLVVVSEDPLPDPSDRTVNLCLSLFL